MLTDEQVIQLKLTHKQTREKRLADRIKAILMVHSGFTYEQITQALLLDEVTIRRYFKQFQKKGIDGLLEYRYSGGQSRLTLLQAQGVKEYFEAHTPRTAKEAVDYLQKTHGIYYSVIGVTKLLHRLGFAYKKPKIIPGKVDLIKQKEFVKSYRETKATLGVNDRMYFLDSTHPQHNTQPDYGWILKGKKNDKYIKTNSGRERLNLNGAFNFNDKTAIVLEEKTINAIALIHLLETIGKKQKTGKVYVVLDNAKHHHALIVRRWRLHHPRFKFLFLPPYSPNLNLIERLWRFFHQQVTWNHYFETFEEFKSTTLTFFKNLKLYEKELSTLLTDNFQLLPAQ
jgi:transposase